MSKPFHSNISPVSYEKLAEMKSTNVASQDAKYLIRIIDDSMSPKIEKGSLISIVSKDTYHSEDMVLAFVGNDKFIFCCLWVAPKEVYPDTVILLPLNIHEYDPYIVIGASRKLFILGAAEMMVTPM